MDPQLTDFARMLLSLAQSPGSTSAAAEFAAQRWGAQSKAYLATKDATAGASTGNWGGPIHGEYSNAIAAFLALVRERSIVGRLADRLRRVPFNTPILVQTGGGNAAWTAEGKPMPVIAGSYDRRTLNLLKIGAITVATTEMLDAPDAESVLTADLARAVADASDTAFIDPANGGVTGETPASVTYGAPVVPIALLDDDDIAEGLASFTGDLTQSAFIAHPQLIASLPSDRFPGALITGGGHIKGVPLLPCNALPRDENDEHQLVLIDPSSIAYAADDPATRIKSTTQGTIEMLDDALVQDATAATGTTSLVSMFQAGAVALAALRWENWRVERPGSVIIFNTEAAS